MVVYTSITLLFYYALVYMLFDKPTYIYVLRDPNSNEIRYVGKTVQSPRNRLWAHLAPSELAKPYHRTRWLNTLIQQGQKPILEVIETVPANGDWIEAEQRWIAYYTNSGAPLTNGTIGGEGAPGAKRSEELRRRHGDLLRGIPRKPEHKAKIAESKAAEPHRALMAKVNQGTVRNRPGKMSKYVGTLFHKGKAEKGHKPWSASLRVRGTTYNKGYFYTDREAAEAYNLMVLDHLGPDAKLNIFDD